MSGVKDSISVTNIVVRALVFAALFCLAPIQSVEAGIQNTKHNLSLSGTGNKTPYTTDVCSFCHTPHSSNKNADTPLWNRILPSPATFTTADSSLTGQKLPVGSVSLACLSCHDGSQALDVLINAPEADGYNAEGQSQGWNFTQRSRLNGSGGTSVGTNLRGLHPVGVRFAGGDAGDSGKLPALSDKYPVATYDFTKNYWWVDTEAVPNGERNSTDLILYTRFFGGDTLPTVECGSCHDPHSEQGNFLRIANQGNKLCGACHGV